MATIKKIKKTIFRLCLVVAILVAAGALLLRFYSYGASNTAELVAQQDASEASDVLYFPKSEVGQENLPAIIFYPGAFVAPASYSIWAHALALQGYPVYIIKLPLNLAVLAPKKAAEVIEKYQLTDYVLGGHSLGGVMASRFAHDHADDHLKGIFFLASYPDEKGRLDEFNLPVLSITGSRDGVLDWDDYAAAQKFLPAQTNYKMIQGGNHAGFGSYGAQKGDFSADITNSKQQTLIAEAIITWLSQQKNQEH